MKRALPLLVLTLLVGCSTASSAPAISPVTSTETGYPSAERTSAPDAPGAADAATATTEGTGIRGTPAAYLIADVPAFGADSGSLAWSPDGGRLVYTGPEHQLTLLDLTSPGSPRQMTSDRAGYPIFTPDGEAVVYAGAGLPRQGRSGGWRPATLYLQELSSGEAVDLLPGDLAVQSVSTTKRPLRWLDGDRLAYQESMGTSVARLFVLNVSSGAVIAEPELAATVFRWSPDGVRVAGQWLGGPPAGFWVWDQQAGYMRQPAGTWEVFETWSPDGQELLYSEWHCDLPYCPQGASALWRLNLATGQRQLVAEDAGLAAWSAAGQIAYVQLGEHMELVVTDAGTGERLWTQELGPRPAELERSRWDVYRPQLEGGYLAIRNAQGDWFMSRVEAKDIHLIYSGVESRLIWSPGGRHLAILDGGATGRLLVLENRL